MPRNRDSLHRVSVLMDDDTYRSFKAICSSVGLAEYVVLLRSFIFANALATERVIAIVTDDDKNVLDFSDVMQIVVHNNAQAREHWYSIDHLAGWVRRAAIHIAATAYADAEDFPALRRQARRLNKDNPWTDPKAGK